MELQNVEHALGQGLMHKRLLGIHEHTHPHTCCGNAAEMALACSSVT